MDSSIRSAILASAFTSLLVSGIVLFAVPKLTMQPMGAEREEIPENTPDEMMEENDGDEEDAEDVSSAIVAAVKKAEPAVVSVIISKDLPVLERYYENPFGDGASPFEFGIPRSRDTGETERREVGGGTAFFISSDGLLMTNKHVASDEEADYTVLLNDGRKLDAKVVARDPGNDIALLQVEGSDFPSLSFASGDAELGETVIAIGNALGEFRNTVSVGVVSGLSRSITAGGGGETERLDRILQTDAAINRGNSGGPLLNAGGEVIGMNTAVAAGGKNIGFAIPAPDLKRALESYEKSGRIVRPYLGIRYMPITPELKEKNSLSFDYGILIVRGETPSDLAVIPGSPADKASIRENDIILEADGERLTLETSLASIVQQ